MLSTSLRRGTGLLFAGRVVILVRAILCTRSAEALRKTIVIATDSGGRGAAKHNSRKKQDSRRSRRRWNARVPPEEIELCYREESRSTMVNAAFRVPQMTQAISCIGRGSRMLDHAATATALQPAVSDFAEALEAVLDHMREGEKFAIESCRTLVKT